MICLGLFGALSINNYRWGYFAVSCCFFLIVLWGLFDTVAKVSTGSLLFFLCQCDPVRD
jgi:bacteriorhodopsin